VTEKASLPVFFVVDEDKSTVDALVSDLERRFAADYRVVGEFSSPAALERLVALRDAGEQVAMIISRESMQAMSGSELLARSRSTHPDAKRILLVDYGDPQMLDCLAQGMASGDVEHYVTRPWRSRERFLYPVVGEALAEWTRRQPPGFQKIRIVGDRWHPYSYKIRDAMERNNVPYGFYDRDSPEGAELLGQLDEIPDHPVVFAADGRILTDYTAADIAEAAGARIHPPRQAYDLVVVGAGPAGLSAAVYGASEGLSTLVLERLAMGGQAGTSARIRNFLGFPAGISGDELAQRMFQQARLIGAEFVWVNPAAALAVQGEEMAVTLADGEQVTTGAVVLATGVTYRRLRTPGVADLIGAGVFYGSAVAEAAGLKNQDIFIVGVGNSAGQAAIYFARSARSVTLLARSDTLANSMSDYLTKEIESTANVHVRLHTDVAAARGDYRLRTLVLRDRSTGQEEAVPAAGLFVMIGASPHTDWLPDSIARDQHGYVLTGRDVPACDSPGDNRPPPLPLETSLPGVFAAGDVRAGSVKRVASAVGEGAVAIPQIHQYLQRQAIRSAG
jgi:thioredoxin reductase (NADPH)